jgi:hypothetical protein
MLLPFDGGGGGVKECIKLIYHNYKLNLFISLTGEIFNFSGRILQSTQSSLEI